MKKLLPVLLLTSLPSFADNRLFTLEDKMSFNYLNTGKANLASFTVSKEGHVASVGYMHYEDKEFDFGYESGAGFYTYVSDTWTLGGGYVQQTDKTKYYSLTGSKTFSWTEDLHSTLKVQGADLSGTGFANNTLESTVTLLYNLTDKVNVAGFTKYSTINVTKGFEYAEDYATNHGLVISYHTEELTLTYTVSSNNSYGMEDISNLLLASVALAPSLDLQGFYYSSDNLFIEDTVGLGFQINI